MTPSPSMLPVSGEAHKKAIEAVIYRKCCSCSEATREKTEFGYDLAAYFASLAAQGVRLVDVREVAEWLDDQCGSARAHWFLARFGGGDER